MNSEMMKIMSRYTLNYRDHTIILKQDFGDQFHLIDGMPCMFGYNVVKNGCNPMPGAMWFQTVKAAKNAIDILIETDGNTPKFWAGIRRLTDNEYNKKYGLYGGLIKVIDGVEYA